MAPPKKAAPTKSPATPKPAVAKPDPAPEAATPLAPPEPPAPGPNLTVKNCIKGTSLWLADGRTLAFGESAETTADEAEFLRGRGQVE